MAGDMANDTGQENTEQLTTLRTQIDTVDSELLSLLNQRAALAQAVGTLKRGTVYRAEREAQVLRRMAAQNPGPLSDKSVMFLFREIMSACLALEHPLRVAYLGPQGTFSHAASLRQFGHAALLQPCVSIDEVFHDVEAGNTEYGVVPVENSTEGAVNRTLDLLQTTPLFICGEMELRIHHVLMRKMDGLDGVRVIYSHAQSFAQCHDWISRHLPGVAQVAVASNAEAARLAGQDASALAIASEEAARQYGLQCLFMHIEDEADNTTRFMVIGKSDAEQPSGQDKTSLLMASASASQPGAIVRLLEPFRDAGVSLTKLESRPARQALFPASVTPWEYVFFVDIEGHRKDVSVQAALERVKTEASFLRVLGSYPRCVL